MTAPGDPAIVVGATIGKLTVAPKWTKDHNVSRHLGVIRLKNENSPEYYAYLLKSDIYQKIIFSQTVGSAQPVINLKALSQIKISIPPLPEQKQISSILSNIDIQIQKEKIHKSNLEKLKKGLMQKLLTGQIRVKMP